ncbi:MAG TPA: LysR family transcriptional regulator [Xanthobacteraceae bacterium]|nr:LysR family transcriptional regulator [Xanthobacteraceae bacterium]
MNIRQLETFVSIVRLGSFSAAAESLNATQSTVSARIQELEQTLGVLLFDRGTRRPQLTAKGRELIAYADRAVELFAEIKYKVGAAEELSGVVRMGVAELIAVTWLPDLVAAMRQRFPRLVLQLEVDLNPDLFAKLNEGKLDIAMVAGPVSGMPYEARDVGSVQFAWMASGALDLPAKVWTPEDLAELPMIYQGTESYTRQLMRKWLGSNNDHEPHSICNSMGGIASLATAGVGVGFLPLQFYADHLASGKLQKLETDPPPPQMRFAVIYPARQNLPVMELLADLAAEVSTFDLTTHEKGQAEN